MKATGRLDRSGSCAICVLVVENTAYVANVGDSRAILSKSHGRQTVSLSEDHKPEAPAEKARIVANGGQTYQTQSQAKVPDGSGNLVDSVIMGPV